MINDVDWGAVKTDFERVIRQHRISDQLYLTEQRLASELVILLITMQSIADVAALHGAAKNPA